LLNRMIIVGSGFPAEVHALHVGDAGKDDEGMTNVTRLVDRMIDMIEVLREYRELTGREDILPVSDRNERVGLALNALERRGPCPPEPEPEPQPPEPGTGVAGCPNRGAGADVEPAEAIAALVTPAGRRDPHPLYEAVRRHGTVVRVNHRLV